MRYCAARRRFV